MFPCILMPQSNVNNAKDSQLWFWERDLDDQFYLKSKTYQTKILDDYQHSGRGSTLSKASRPKRQAIF